MENRHEFKQLTYGHPKERFFARTMEFSMILSTIVAALLVSIHGAKNIYTHLSAAAFTLSFLLWLEHYMYYNSYLTADNELHLKIGTHCQIGGYFAMLLGLLFLFKGYKQNYAYYIALAYIVLYTLDKIVDYAHYLRDTAPIVIGTRNDYSKYLKDNSLRLIVPSTILSLATIGMLLTIRLISTRTVVLALIGFMIMYGLLLVYYIRILHPILKKIRGIAERLL